jgi:hypothetical protein
MSEDRAMVPAPEGGLSFGQSHLRPQDFIPPRVKIVQLMSKENGNDGIVPGDLFNTLTLEGYGASLKVAPIQTVMQRIFMLRDTSRDRANALLLDANRVPLVTDRDGLACRSFNMVEGLGDPGGECEKCPLSKWIDNLPPLCSETYNIVGVTELGELVVLSFSKSGAKAAKRWFSMIRMMQASPWTRTYEVTTVKQTGAKGIFWTPEVRRLQEPTPSDVLRSALDWAKQLQGVVIDVTPLEEDAVEDAGPDQTPDLAGAQF